MRRTLRSTTLRPERTITKALSKKAPRKSAPATRVVDLGREDELVTWQEWLGRSMEAMREAIPESDHDRLIFRITLHSGRAFAAKNVLTHVSRGMCTLVPERWVEDEQATTVRGMPICEVITGYIFLGSGDDELASALCVPPTEIASVECVLTESQPGPESFGFAAARMHIPAHPAMQEIEEPSRAAAARLHTEPDE